MGRVSNGGHGKEILWEYYLNGVGLRTINSACSVIRLLIQAGPPAIVLRKAGVCELLAGPKEPATDEDIAPRTDNLLRILV